MEEPEIRELKLEDREAMEAFFKQMGPETQSLFNPHNCNYIEIMKFFNRTEVPEEHKRWIAMENGSVIGYVFLWDANTGIPDLGIALAENVKGRHLGRKFLDVAVDWCRENGKGGVMLTTHVANVRAQMLYENYGFKRMGPYTWTELLYIYRF